MTDISPAPTLEKSTALSAYSHGWKALRFYFLELLLIGAAYIVLTLPTAGLWGDDAAEIMSKYVSFNLIFFEISGAPGAVLFSTAYAILIEWPLQYGVDYASLTAVRSDTPRISTLFAGFRNFWNAVLANLLVTALVVIGFFMLIIPGFFILVRVVFVPYLVVDRGMDAVEAVKRSWEMTRGHGWKIFRMIILAFFIGIAGVAAFGVGIVISLIWINLAFASLYQTVDEASASDETPQEA